MRVEGFNSSCSPSFEPLAHRSFAHSQGYCNVFLSPSSFFQLPGTFAPFFSPIGFLWCSHASYFSILYLLPPRSVSPYSVVVVTLHRGGGAESYSFAAPGDGPATPALVHTTCGNQGNALTNTTAC